MAVVRSRSERSLAAVLASHPVYVEANRAQAEEGYNARLAALEAREASLRQREENVTHREQALQVAIDEGLAQETEGWQEALTTLTQALEKVRADADAIRRAAAGQCVELSLLMAAKLVGRVAAEENSWLVERWEELLAAAEGFDHIIVTVPEAALPIIQKHLEQFGSETEIELRPDATLPTGGCRVHFGGTTLEADLGHQWQQLTKHYRDQSTGGQSEVGHD